MTQVGLFIVSEPKSNFMKNKIFGYLMKIFSNDGLENLSSDFELVDEDNELPPDTYLEEEINKRIQDDRLLNNPSISRWRKNKILNSRNDGEIKTY